MPGKLRVLFVDAINPAVEVESRYPSLGMAYLVSAARKALPGEIEFKIAGRDVQSVAESFKPHVVGISSVSQNFNIANDYAGYFSQKGTAVVMGGVHISAIPGCLPDGAAAACLGESEETFVELIKAYLGGGFSPETLAGISGIAFREGGEIKLTAPRPQIQNMDNIAMPARNLLDIQPHTYMFTSRGCPYRCTFCSSTRFWDKLRFFSAEYVVDEIGLLVRDYGVSMISFFDDLFAANTKRLEEIAVLLEKRGLNGKVKYTCSCRANVVKPELAKILKRLGVVSVGMGLESGDEETLKYLKGGTVNVAHNSRAIEVLKSAGIAANASFVIGSPDETFEQSMKTYNFIRKSRLDLFDIYLLTPYPGTPVWDYAKRRGLVSDDMDWSRLDVNVYREPGKAIILSETMKKEEVFSLYKRFRRLRFRRNLVKVFNHPMRRDLPMMAWKLFKEKVSALAESRQHDIKRNFNRHE